MHVKKNSGTETFHKFKSKLEYSFLQRLPFTKSWGLRISAFDHVAALKIVKARFLLTLIGLTTFSLGFRFTAQQIFKEEITRCRHHARIDWALSFCS